jgi:hypothetical protein
VNAPGSVFGELAVLLDQPHTADVRTLEQSEFYPQPDDWDRSRPPFSPRRLDAFSLTRTIRNREGHTMQQQRLHYWYDCTARIEHLNLKATSSKT